MSKQLTALMIQQAKADNPIARDAIKNHPNQARQLLALLGEKSDPSATKALARAGASAQVTQSKPAPTDTPVVTRSRQPSIQL